MTRSDTIGSRLGSRPWHDGHTDRVRVDTPPINPELFYVYIAWGLDRSRPLYIGKSKHLVVRIGQHMARAEWVKYATEFECFAFASELEALNAESLAIHKLDPEYNVHRGLHRPRKPGTKTPKPRVWLRRFDGLTDADMEVITRVQNRGKVA